MSAHAYTPSLPGLSTTDEVDTVISWGLGADSTACLARILTDPAAYGIDLGRTVVLYVAISSEAPETRMLVDVSKPGYQKLLNAFVFPPGTGSARPAAPPAPSA
jgi:hypothetical protein